MNIVKKINIAVLTFLSNATIKFKITPIKLINIPP